MGLGNRTFNAQMQQLSANTERADFSDAEIELLLPRGIRKDRT